MKKASVAWMRLTAVGVAVVASLPVAAGAASAADTVYTMADVQQHATAADCWSAINGKVYNFTEWVNKHPGGSLVITSLCGIDGSAAFSGRHGNQPGPAAALHWRGCRWWRRTFPARSGTPARSLTFWNLRPSQAGVS